MQESPALLFPIIFYTRSVLRFQRFRESSKKNRVSIQKWISVSSFPRPASTVLTPDARSVRKITNDSRVPSRIGYSQGSSAVYASVCGNRSFTTVAMLLGVINSSANEWSTVGGGRVQRVHTHAWSRVLLHGSFVFQGRSFHPRTLIKSSVPSSCPKAGEFPSSGPFFFHECSLPSSRSSFPADLPLRLLSFPPAAGRLSRFRPGHPLPS